MEISEFVKYIVEGFIAIGGWIFGGIQFSKKRKYEKQDKKLDVYLHYMKLHDDLNLKYRTDKMSFDILRTAFQRVVIADEKDILFATLEFNQKLVEAGKEAIQPIQILNCELSQVELVASRNLRDKIKELRELTNLFANEYAQQLSKLKVQKAESFKALDEFANDERWNRISVLDEIIVNLMRKEIGMK